MSILVRPGIVLLIGLAAACNRVPAPTAAPEATAPPPARIGTLRVEAPASTSVLDLPWHAALETLGQQGYTIEPVAFDDITLAIVAMSGGELDLAVGGYLVTWAAIAEGAEIATVLERATNTWAIIGRDEVRTCADLDGQRVGVNNLSGVTTAMFNAYVERNCPEARPELLVIASAASRQAALLNGELDAVVLFLDALLAIEDEAPGRFHVLATFAEEFPGLTISGFTVRRGLAQEYPETVKDVIRAVMLERRRLQDPQALRDAIMQYLELEAEAAQAMADIFLEYEPWDVNGALSRETVQVNLEFLQESAGLAPDLTPEAVADLSFLDAVLDEIGRQ